MSPSLTHILKADGFLIARSVKWNFNMTLKFASKFLLFQFRLYINEILKKTNSFNIIMARSEKKGKNFEL